MLRGNDMHQATIAYKFQMCMPYHSLTLSSIHFDNEFELQTEFTVE